MSAKIVGVIKKSVSLFIVSAVLLSCVGCGTKSLSSVSIAADAKPVYPQSADLSSHYCDSAKIKEIAASGLITLLFDEHSTAVGVRITGSDDSKLWSVLPQTAEGAVTSDEAEIIGIEVIHDGKKYYLNSQDNCVSFGGAFWNNTDDGFVVTYLITDNSACIKSIDAGATDEAYKTAANGNILYKAVVTYTLKDGCMYASLDWTNLGKESDVLVNIGFLEYFGATTVSQEGDFILVPDGSGAVINTFSAENVDPVSIAVYGNDIGGAAELSSVVAAYGMKNGSDALAAVIENGDAFASINAKKAGCDSSYNSVGASFTVTPSINENGTVYYSQLSNKEPISICFRFLSGVNATYSGIAAACREQLIRNYTLSTRTVEEDDDTPVVVNVIGSAEKPGFFSIPQKLTTCSEAIDSLTRLKSRGINNVYLRCSGFLAGGLNAENAANATVLSSLGGKSGLSDLDEYAAGQNFKVFVDVDLLTDSKTNGTAALNILGKAAEMSTENVLTKTGYIVEIPTRRMLSISSLSSTVLSVLKRFNGLNSTGYCVNDVGTLLYSDFKNGSGRQSVCDVLGDSLAPLSTQSLVMVQNGNFYSLKNADIVSGLPMTCKHETSEAYTAVPFVQIILHGIVDFSYDEINLSSDTKTSFLRCVEFGALPGFVLTNRMFDGSDEYAKTFSADNWLTYMYDCYKSASETLSDLRGARITNHYSVSSGVFCTEYESTTRIYVNYTDSAYVVSGITVEPMSFFRVN